MSTRIRKRALAMRKAPRQARALATYEAILEAAAHILSVKGLEGFNTNAIAARAGASVGSLYQYFPNKDALMAVLIERQRARRRESLERIVAAKAPGGLAKAVRELVRAAMREHREDSLLASAIDHEESRLGDVLPDDDSGAYVVNALAVRFADELSGLDRARASRTLPAVVRAAVDAWANLSPPRVRVAEDEAVRLVMGYLAGRGGEGVA